MYNAGIPSYTVGHQSIIPTVMGKRRMNVHFRDGTILQLSKIRFKCVNFDNNFHINAKLYHVITLFKNYNIM